jgi:hypothetical protein
MSPSSNPQERFTQPLLINPSRSLDSFLAVANFFQNLFFPLVQDYQEYRRSRPRALPLSHHASISVFSADFFRSRRNLGRPSDDFEDFDKLLLMLHFQSLQEFGRCILPNYLDLPSGQTPVVENRTQQHGA